MTPAVPGVGGAMAPGPGGMEEEVVEGDVCWLVGGDLLTAKLFG